MTKTLTVTIGGKTEVLKFIDGIVDRLDVLNSMTSENWEWVSVEYSDNYALTPYERNRKYPRAALRPEFFCSFSPIKEIKEVEVKEPKPEKPKGGKRGRAAKPVDPKIIEGLKGLLHLTIKEASDKLGVSYSLAYVLAKKNGLTFKVGQRGRKK